MPNVVNQGGRTYWQGPIDGNAEEASDFPKEVLDEKSLNCVGWYMAQAACAFDGGRLADRIQVESAEGAPSSRDYGAPGAYQVKTGGGKWPFQEA